LKANLKILNSSYLYKLRLFIKNNWSKKHILAQNKNFLIWQYKNKNKLSAAAAIFNEKILGIQMYIPQSHYDKKLSKKQIFLTIFRCLETKVPGISVKIFKYILMKLNPSFIGTTGFSHKMINFHKWQGFNVGLMNHYVALSPFKKKFIIAKVPRGIKKFKISKKINKLKIIEITKSNIHLYKVHKSFYEQTPIKSKTFVLNRFIKHPYYKYSIYALINKKKIMSLCILRKINKSKTSAFKIVDYIGNQKYFIKYNPIFLELIKKYSAEYIDFYSYGIDEKYINEAGFINRRKYKNLVIPEYFEPYIKKNIDLMYGYINKTKKKVKIFKGDGDRDRPN